jgi:hypothetical protein
MEEGKKKVEMPPVPQKPGPRILTLQQQIKALEAEWDRLDPMGTQTVRQQEIADQVKKLKGELHSWYALHQAVDSAKGNYGEKF